MTRTKARVCGTKHPHSKAGAEQHRASLIKAGQSPGQIEVYRCRKCGRWHVGHPVRRGRR